MSGGEAGSVDFFGDGEAAGFAVGGDYGDIHGAGGGGQNAEIAGEGAAEGVAEFPAAGGEVWEEKYAAVVVFFAVDALAGAGGCGGWRGGE